MSRIGAIVITYNSGAVIERCIAAAVSQGIKVVVVDNQSSDDSVEKARRTGARVIANTENFGFAYAANQGFEALTNGGTDDSSLLCVLLLNPDVEITTSLQPMERACTEHGASCGLLQDVDNKPQSGFQLRRFPTPTVLAFEVLGLNRLELQSHVLWSSLRVLF
jgi:GT2 family glycosyltransferase